MQTTRIERNWRAALLPIGALLFVTIGLLVIFALQAKSSPARGAEPTTVQDVVNQPPVGGDAIDLIPANAIDTTTGMPIWDSPGGRRLTDSEVKILTSGNGGNTPCAGGVECDP